MVRTLSLAAALCLAAATGAAAQTVDGGYAPARHRAHRVEANGRCDGTSYGTGARRCGSRTGGPSGGISSRN